MANALLLKTDQNPSYFNKELVIGTLLFPVVGTVIGAIIGKRRIERESTVGKLVTEQHETLNKDTIIGALLGGALGSGVMSMLALTGPVGALIGLAAFAGGAIFGGMVGNKFDERQHAAEWEMAKHQTIVRNISASVSPEMGSAVEYALSHNKSWAKDITERQLLEQSQQRIH